MPTALRGHVLSRWIPCPRKAVGMAPFHSGRLDPLARTPALRYIERASPTNPRRPPPMANVNPAAPSLTAEERQQIKSWLTEFHQSWNKDQFAARVAALPPSGIGCDC